MAGDCLLQLDAVFFEDGMTVGPDESGLFERIAAAISRQRAAAEDIVDALQSGASIGQIFEKLRPLAQERRLHPDNWTFVMAAVDTLLQQPQESLLPWFASYLIPLRVPLRRPPAE